MINLYLKWAVKNKGFEQIKDISDSYIAADEIGVGSGNKMPLWLFGLLY